KYGLWGLTQMLARALAPDVRVNAIGPGPTLPSPRQTDEQFAAQWRATPLGQPVDPRDICRALRFILDAPAVTGQIIALDSGQHMGAAWDNAAAPE
ncbi:MAG: SDR family oxidoreductase, partial [Rhodospirillales bacterium]